MAHLFVYGTLMFEDIFSSVAGASAMRKKARLGGFRRYEVKDEVYPGMVEQPGAVVEGAVWFDIPASSWPRLDRFEGEMYLRRSVEVELEGGGSVLAETYVVKNEYRRRLGEGDWDGEAFQARGKDYFVRYYHGYDELE